MPPDTGSDNGNWIKRMTALAIRNLAQRGSIPLFLGVGLPLFLLNGISRQPSDNGKRVGFNLHCFVRHSQLYSYFEGKKCLYVDRSLIKSWLTWLSNGRITVCLLLNLCKEQLAYLNPLWLLVVLGHLFSPSSYSLLKGGIRI